MIRPLRRAHLLIWSGMGVGLPAALLFAFRHRELRPAPGPRPPQADEAAGPVVAAAAWPVWRDTLYLQVEASGDTVRPWAAQFSVSATARWPDAVVYWSPEPTPEAPLTNRAVPLGPVGARADLRAPLPARGGTFHLLSAPWARRLGSWTAPLPADGSPP